MAGIFQYLLKKKFVIFPFFFLVFFFILLIPERILQKLSFPVSLKTAVVWTSSPLSAHTLMAGCILHMSTSTYSQTQFNQMKTLTFNFKGNSGDEDFDISAEGGQSN